MADWYEVHKHETSNHDKARNRNFILFGRTQQQKLAIEVRGALTLVQYTSHPH